MRTKLLSSLYATGVILEENFQARSIALFLAHADQNLSLVSIPNPSIALTAIG